VCDNTRFCCAGAYASDAECCQNSFTLSRSTGTATRQLGGGAIAGTCAEANATTTAECTPAPSSSGGTSTVAITAGVLGSFLLAVSVALVLVFLNNLRLKKMLDEKPSHVNFKYQQGVYDATPQEMSAVTVPSELPTAYPGLR